MNLLTTKQGMEFLDIKSRGAWDNHKRGGRIAVYNEEYVGANKRHMYAIPDLEKARVAIQERKKWFDSGVWRKNKERTKKEIKEARSKNNYDNLMARM